MKNLRYSLALVLFTTLFLGSCSSGGQDSEDSTQQESEGQDNVPIDNQGTDNSNNQGEETPAQADTNSLATSGCQNVVIINGFAYAACSNGIEVVNLQSFERNFVSLLADDITGDADVGVLFTQSGNTLQQFDLADPMQPSPVATVNTNFSIFSGISAANGILVVSAGSGGSNTEVFTYDASSLSLVIGGIPQVDNKTGNPDVHVASTSSGALAFYSQDLGAVANWGIQIVEFDSNGNILDVPDVVVLTPGQFTGSFSVPFGPANFPVESEYLNDRLYTAHFAAAGIHVIDRSASDTLSLIPLGYEPTNIATDGNQLFVVGVSRNTVDVINPITEAVVDTLTMPLQQPVGIAASASHLVIADRAAGLIVTRR